MIEPPAAIVDALLQGASLKALIELLRKYGARWDDLSRSQRALCASAHVQGRGYRAGPSRKSLALAYDTSFEAIIRARRLRLSGSQTSITLVALGVMSALNRNPPMVGARRSRRTDPRVRGEM